MENYNSSLLQYAWRTTQVQVFGYVTAGLRSPENRHTPTLADERYELSRDRYLTSFMSRYTITIG